MNNQDNKFYFSKKYGVYIHKTLAVVQDESNPIYQQQLAYQRNDGVFEDIDDQYIHISVKVPSLIEEEAKKYEKRIEDGIQTIAKISAEFRIARIAGMMPEESHQAIEEILEPVRREILAGQWINAKRKLEDIGIQAVGKPPYIRLLTEIDNYIAENYD